MIISTISTNVLLPDLDYLLLEHPEELDLSLLFTKAEIDKSTDLQEALSNDLLKLESVEPEIDITLTDLVELPTGSAMEGDILTYSDDDWVVSSNKLSWVWAGAINSSKAKGTRTLIGNNRVTLQSVPFFAWCNCVIKTVVLSNKIAGQPWSLDIMSGNRIIATLEQDGTKKISHYKNLSIKIAEDSSIWLRMRSSSVDFPSAICYVQEL